MKIEPSDSVNLDELSAKVEEMTRLRIAKREEELKTDWDRKIADALAGLNASVERVGNITKKLDDPLFKQTQIMPSLVITTTGPDRNSLLNRGGKRPRMELSSSKKQSD